MQTAEEVTMTALSLMFLLIGVVLITSIVYSAFNPYEQISMANARKLAAVMNQACISGSDTPITIQFNLPQSIPLGSNFFTVLPRWLMRSFGDPNYVLYYESFPPGEAIGWETYHELDHRLYIILPQRFAGMGIESDVKPYADSMLKKFSNDNPQLTLEGYVIVNVMLNDAGGLGATKLDRSKLKTDELLARPAQSGSTGGAATSAPWGDPATLFFGFGQWDSAKDGGAPAAWNQEDFFRFKNYNALPTVEKTLIKYQSCGPYSLCLKTRSGIYRFPLTNCENKIKTVQLVYDNRNRKAIYGTIVAAAVGASIAAPVVGGGSQLILPGMEAFFAKTSTSLLARATTAIAPRLGSAASAWWGAGSIGKLTFIGTGSYVSYHLVGTVMGAMFSFKTGDLVLVSPCHITDAQVVMSSCTNTAVPNSVDYNPCSSYVTYPLFTVDATTKKLVKAEHLHYVCADKIETKPDAEAIAAAGTEFDVEKNDGGQCLQLKVFDAPDGFCWTPDPSANDLFSWNFDTSGLAKLIGFAPVRDAVASVSRSNAIVLLPTRNEELEDFASRWERRLAWGWPGLESKK